MLTKNKSIISTLIFVLILISLSFSLIACGSEDLGKITNESGFTVQGGDFPEGSVLDAMLVNSESEEGKQAIEKIEGYSYDKTKPVYVFEVSVKKDGEKVQPNGKVKITIPVSEDLTGYDVLHIKDNGKVERLAVTYKNGKATFETSSFSKFVFVKKVSPSGSESGGDGGEDDGITKHAIKLNVRRIVPGFLSEGGTIRDVNDEDIAYTTQNIAEGTEYTIKSFCYPDYYFVGWYEASEREEATEETLISKDVTYTFTVTKNLNICAIYANKTDALELTLDADWSGFSFVNGKPTLTLVTKGSTDTPNHETVDVFGWLADGSAKNYGSYSSSSSNFTNNVIMDDGGLDYTKVGTYTITYSYKYNTNIKATLSVRVVESAYTLKVSTNGNNLKFRYNVSTDLDSIEKVIPEDKPVTLTAEPKDGYAFTGWYDENNNFVSKDLVYCFEMPKRDVTLSGKYEASTISLGISVGYYSEGELVDDFGNAYFWSYRTIYFKPGETVSFTIRERGYYDFLGWFDVVNDDSTLITTNNTINLTLNESRSIYAKFRERLKSMEVDPTTLLNEGFENGRIGFAIGDTAIDYENFAVKAYGVAGSYLSLSVEDYTIDDGNIDFNTIGTYTITYTYRYDSKIKTQLQISVIDPQDAQFAFEKSYSYLDHKYDGKATFISLKDVKMNGIPLYEFKTGSKIWEKISYKWIDKSTNKEVDSTDADITINGTVVKDFGPKDDKMTIGNEFGGPVKAGSYRFELMYNGETVITQDSTISTQVYKKITTSSEFKTNEGSSWINFKMYYYTIIGYANGKYYVMQMPSIGDENYEAEAREIAVDANGNAVIGEGDDFAFVNARYFANDYSGYTEFLTGYYGSYVVRSSSNTVDGTIAGSPYIYRTGHIFISDGKICRKYGNKSNYGLSTVFDDDGAVTIHSRYSQDTNGRLRLVKDGDKYVFTSAPADTDTRESFKVFIYQSKLETTE